MFGINVFTGLDTPWFLFPTFGMGIGMMRNYARLWQSGYSWRDVLTRPPAPDAIETTLMKGVKPARALPAPNADDYGAHLGSIMQAHGDRQAILKLMERLPPSERKMLPEIQQTVDALYERATDLARTLHALGRPGEAESMANEALDLGSPDDVEVQVFSRLAQAGAKGATGAVEEAIAIAREAVDIAERTDASAMRGDALLELGRLLRAAGSDADADVVARRALEHYEAKGSRVGTAVAREFLAAEEVSLR